jgi:hypothetical protein
MGPTTGFAAVSWKYRYKPQKGFKKALCLSLLLENNGLKHPWTPIISTALESLNTSTGGFREIRENSKPIF